ncbi:ATP-dependent endonuclease [Aliivibrio sp. 1S165]|jgi:putative ATP-dependent endonuclease of OLD family|uniref:ATP-dependent endonuclease n=1 Tax=unclassified Aliivibrio TaxID=2645654 RepID=UPI00080DA156|nr:MULTISPECIES: ATP-dependent endonuclease [unclassified Aliivibrio]OCH16493.1 ATP-dependent endonuclease [Aliivibrio sp. 1S165]OCH33930.1 ATP-dependent endonuclease [Aliivibrio sp. 1S175]
MLLERIEVSGFRGIKRLSLSFEQLTTLIGENTWGKSSLLDALSIALPVSGELHQFTLKDFHQDHSISYTQDQHIQIIISWKTTEKNEHKAGRYRKLSSLWQSSADDDYQRIYYRISATNNEGKITSSSSFLSSDGEILRYHKIEYLITELMRLHPVIRIRDSRRLNFEEMIESLPNDRVERRINNTCRRLMTAPGQVNSGEIKSALHSMQSLVEHYFAFKHHKRNTTHRIHDDLFFGQKTDGVSLSQFINQNKNKQTKLLLLGLLNTYLRAKGPNTLKKSARPLMIIEDPEGRLHPTQLIQAWSLLNHIPMQKILTTNSSELLSAVPLCSIRRLVRESDSTSCYSVSPTSLSRDDLRRITFHIRFQRTNALFARCWLLVEGETEVWLFNEMARMLGYNLAAEGVQIIEFAQSGLKSLIKIAKALHIEWHVVTDGDPAGKKYAFIVKNQLDNEHERHRLTELPHKDIEHYLYHNGFEALFRSLSNITKDQPVPPKKIIIKALKKFAKPDLALAIVQHSEELGPESIPVLLRWTLKRTVTMAKGQG